MQVRPHGFTSFHVEVIFAGGAGLGAAAGVDRVLETIAMEIITAHALRRAADARAMRGQEALHEKLLLRLFVAKKSRHPQETNRVLEKQYPLPCPLSPKELY